MTKPVVDEAQTLYKLKYRLRGSGYFVVAKYEKFFLYRETPPRNTLVIAAKSFTRFLSRVQHATGVKPEIVARDSEVQ